MDDELADILGFEPEPEAPAEPERQLPPEGRVLVRANLPYLRNYARDPQPALSYGCDFPVAVGDRVAVPPTPLDTRWTEGEVIALGPSDYRGPVRPVRRIEP